MITKRDFLMRGRCFCQKHFSITISSTNIVVPAQIDKIKIAR